MLSALNISPHFTENTQKTQTSTSWTSVFTPKYKCIYPPMFSISPSYDFNQNILSLKGNGGN